MLNALSEVRSCPLSLNSAFQLLETHMSCSWLVCLQSVPHVLAASGCQSQSEMGSSEPTTPSTCGDTPRYPRCPDCGHDRWKPKEPGAPSDRAMRPRPRIDCFVSSTWGSVQGSGVWDEGSSWMKLAVSLGGSPTRARSTCTGPHVGTGADRGGRGVAKKTTCRTWKPTLNVQNCHGKGPECSDATSPQMARVGGVFSSGPPSVAPRTDTGAAPGNLGTPGIKSVTFDNSAVP